MYSAFEADLRELADRGRLRSLRERSGIDFTSNDYLGLAESAELRQAAAACPGARRAGRARAGRACCGATIPSMRRWKARRRPISAARPRLYFGGGYAANFAIFSTLPQRGDLIVHDALIHASVREGCAAAAPIRDVPHNDVDAFDAAIVRWRAGGRQGPGLDLGRKALQHGWRPCPARRTGRGGGSARRHAGDRRGACHRRSTARRAAVWRPASKAATMSSPCTPAARRWARSAACHPGAACHSRLSGQSRAAPLSIAPRRRR